MKLNSARHGECLAPFYCFSHKQLKRPLCPAVEPPIFLPPHIIHGQNFTTPDFFSVQRPFHSYALLKPEQELSGQVTVQLSLVARYFFCLSLLVPYNLIFICKAAHKDCDFSAHNKSWYRLMDIDYIIHGREFMLSFARLVLLSSLYCYLGCLIKCFN